MQLISVGHTNVLVQDLGSTPKLDLSIRARHFVPMGARLVYISRVTRPYGRPWAQNVGL